MSQSRVIPINYIERKPESDYYRIVGKGVTVEFLSRLLNQPDWHVERICQNYGLTPAEIYAAWSFYYDHKAEIDHRLEEATIKHVTAARADHARREQLTRRYQEKTGKAYPDDL